MTIASAILYALFVWWFATGLVLMLVLRAKASRVALVGSAVLFPICLVVLTRTATSTTIAGAYAAFTAAVVLWGTQEVAFLTGVLTGPRARPCPPGARGFDRFCFAVCAILYHETALVATGAAVVMVTAGAANQVGPMTFLVLWVMRLSAKLNLFLGVPVLNDEMLPAQISFIRSYFRRAPANSLLPVTMFLSVFLTWALVDAGLDPVSTPATRAGDLLVASMLGLAILEHAFMLVPLPIGRLWQWSTLGRAADPCDANRLETGPPRLDRVVPTPP